MTFQTTSDGIKYNETLKERVDGYRNWFHGFSINNPFNIFQFLIYDFEWSQNPKILSFLIGTTYPLLLFIGEISLKLPRQGNNSSCFMFCACGIFLAYKRYGGFVRLTIFAHKYNTSQSKPLKMLSTKILRLLNFDVLFSEMCTYNIKHVFLYFAGNVCNAGKYLLVWSFFLFFLFYSANVLQYDFQWKGYNSEKCNGF